jgi:hypothetical protein
MKKIIFFSLFILCVFADRLLGQGDSAYTRPDTHGKGWVNLFNSNISDGIFPSGVWTIRDGVMTAAKDQCIWSKKEYEDFVLDLDFKNAEGTNSGVIVHTSNMQEWIPHSVEIQILDDYSAEWSKVQPNWQCAAVFGHQAPTKRTVKKPGEWNHYTITCKGKKIWVVLNEELVNSCDMGLYTSSRTNPDGTAIPDWLSTPMAELPLHGHIGFQGKHAGAPIYFRNIKILEL